MFARFRPALAHFAWGVVPYLLVAALTLMSGTRYSSSVRLTQCPTAAIQRITVAERLSDGSVVTVVRAPRPGEPGFVCCHCAAKRSAQQTGWVCAPVVMTMIAEPLVMNFPIIKDENGFASLEVALVEPPPATISHPPAA